MRIDLGDVARLFSAQARAHATAGGLVLEHIAGWMRELTQHALLKWPVQLTRGQACGCPGADRTCPATALVVCDICGTGACLAHARIDYMGDAICEGCLARAKRVGRAEKWSPWQAPPDSKSAEAPAREADLGQAYRELKLKRGAPWSEVKRQYKKLARECSPDRPQTDKQRDKNTERMKRVNAAFTVLRDHFEKGPS